MQEIRLSDLIGDQQVALTITTEKIEFHSDTKKFNKEIPEHLKFYHLPKDINQFITQIYPNLKFYISTQTHQTQDIDEIVNNFIVYMLDKSTQNVARWTRYDSTKYSAMPYYRWFISTLRFFQLSYHSELVEKATKELSLVDSHSEEAEVGVMSMENSEIEYMGSLNMEAELYLSELTRFMDKYSEQGSTRFEREASLLFNLLKDGNDAKSISGHLGISPAATGQWIRKMRDLLIRKGMHPTY